MICPQCQQENDDNSKYCIHCGEALQPDVLALQRASSNRGLKIFAGMLGSFIALCLLLFTALRYSIDHTSFRGGSSHDKSQIEILLYGSIVLFSIVPYVAFRFADQRAYAKGVLWGTIIFYILIALCLLMLVAYLKN